MWQVGDIVQHAWFTGRITEIDYTDKWGGPLSGDQIYCKVDWQSFGSPQGSLDARLGKRRDTSEGYKKTSWIDWDHLTLIIKGSRFEG